MWCALSHDWRRHRLALSDLILHIWWNTIDLRHLLCICLGLLCLMSLDLLLYDLLLLLIVLSRSCLVLTMFLELSCSLTLGVLLLSSLLCLHPHDFLGSFPLLFLQSFVSVIMHSSLFFSFLFLRSLKFDLLDSVEFAKVWLEHGTRGLTIHDACICTGAPAIAFGHYEHESLLFLGQRIICCKLCNCAFPTLW